MIFFKVTMPSGYHLYFRNLAQANDTLPIGSQPAIAWYNPGDVEEKLYDSGISYKVTFKELQGCFGDSLIIES